MKKMRRGFTLVELALAMAFIGILSVAVVLIVSNTVAAYRRGMTLSRINTTGMDIVDDMRWAVGNSSSRAVSTDCYRFYQDKNDKNGLDGTLKICVDDDAYNFVSITKTGTVEIDKNGNGNYESKEKHDNVPIYGAFCTGTYSYIWNSGYFEMDGVKINGKVKEEKKEIWAKLKYKLLSGEVVELNHTTRTGKDSENRPFRLLKVRDDYRSVCVSVVRNIDEKNYELPKDNADLSNVFDITGYRALDEEPEDLILADSENDLALFDLYVARPAESTTQKNMFYAVSFILGTTNGGVDILAKGNACEPPTNYKVEDFDYCAINKFNFAIQANGEL